MLTLPFTFAFAVNHDKLHAIWPFLAMPMKAMSKLLL